MKKNNILIDALKQIGIAFLVVIPVMLLFGLMPALLMNTDTAMGNWIKQNMEAFFTAMTLLMVIVGTIGFFKVEAILNKKLKQ